MDSCGVLGGQADSHAGVAGGLLRLAVAADAIPLSRLAMVDGVPVGTVNLIENDDEEQEAPAALVGGGIYVVPERRRQGVGSALVRDLRQCAATLGIRTLYLGTDNPGFYGHLGAMIHEQVTREFAIMQLATRLS